MYQQSSLRSIGQCPKCGGGTNTGCFAVWDHAEHCFTCGYHKSYDKARQFAIRDSRIKNAPGFVGMPENAEQFPDKFSLEALKWLYNYYIFDPRQYNIRYQEHRADGEYSLILPTIENNLVVGYQRRCFPNKKFYTKGRTAALQLFPEQDYVILVEDGISFYRVSQAHSCLGMLGTSVSNDVLSEILYKYRTIVFWTDPDKAGEEARKKLKNQINKLFSKKRQKTPALYLTPVKYLDIMTEKDPKCYSDEEISQEIRRVLCVQQQK